MKERPRARPSSLHLNCETAMPLVLPRQHRGPFLRIPTPKIVALACSIVYAILTSSDHHCAAMSESLACRAS